MYWTITKSGSIFCLENHFCTERKKYAKKVLYDDSNKLRSFIQIYVNNKILIDALWDTPLSEETEILLLPAIAGGAPIEESQDAAVESLISDERRKEVSFDDSEVERFGKHLMLREIGVKGQKRIKAAKVVVIGAGALGSPVIQYLAAAGVGTIKVIDFEEVSLENLQSQVLHGTRDIKRPKVASVKDKVKNINKNIVLEAEKVQLEASNILEQIDGYDLVVDCSNNYKARYLRFSISTGALACVANTRLRRLRGSSPLVRKAERSARFPVLSGASRRTRRSS